MNILFCQPSLEYSGSEKSLVEIVDGIRQHTNHKAYMLAGAQGPMANRFEALVERMWFVNAPKLSRDPERVLPHLRSYLQTYRTIRRIKDEIDIDAVYINTLVFPQAVIGAWLNKLPIVVHVREVETTYPHWYYRGLVGLATIAARRIVCVCDYIRRQTGMPRRFHDKSVVIYNSSGFDTGPIERTMKDGIRILAITPMDRRKGVEDLVPLLLALHERITNPNIRLRVLGRIMDAPLYKDILTQVSEASLTDVVEFIDGADDPAPLYEEANVLIHPSYSEAFPRVLVEAANFSLPVVTTDVGGSPEAVVNKQTGFVVRTGDVEAMAERIDRLRLDPALYQTMSKAAFERYQNHFTRERMIGRLTGVLESLQPEPEKQNLTPSQGDS